MGACESEKRMVKLKESKCMKNIIEVAEFYDVIVHIDSIKDINKWEIIDIDKTDKPRLLRDKDYAFQHICKKKVWE